MSTDGADGASGASDSQNDHDSGQDVSGAAEATEAAMSEAESAAANAPGAAAEQAAAEAAAAQEAAACYSEAVAQDAAAMDATREAARAACTAPAGADPVASDLAEVDPDADVAAPGTPANLNAAPETAQPGTYADSYTAQALSGINEGIANVLGAPVDLAEMGLNGIMAAAEWAGVPESWTPEFENSFLGSNSIKGMMGFTGSIAPESLDPAKRTVRDVAEVGIEIGSAVVGAGLAARGVSVSNLADDALRTIDDVPRARFGTAATTDYRSTFFAANPTLEGQVVVHHAVEQQAMTRYPGVVTETQMHSLENLRGIPKDLNAELHLSDIRREWNRFYRENPTATADDLLGKATEIDNRYGTQFNPPVR